MRERFLELSGYSDYELLAWNPITGLFLTKNGGLYRMSSGGIVDLKGPPSDPEERIE